MQRFLEGDVVCFDSLDRLESILILADTTNRDAQAIDEDAIRDSHICRVGLEGNAII